MTESQRQPQPGPGLKNRQVDHWDRTQDPDTNPVDKGGETFSRKEHLFNRQCWQNSISCGELN